MMTILAIAVLSVLMVLFSIMFGRTHINLFKSLLRTEKVVAYGVYSTFSEMIFCHFYYLLKSLIFGSDREKLTANIENKFLSLLKRDDNDVGKVLITHSCRTIFYCLIKTIIELKKSDSIKICVCSVQFGSFYRLLRAIELAENISIEFYEIDLNLDDWTLNNDQITETEISKCDLILAQHFWGVPFEQNILFKLGKKYDIPILEDCVQSGSLYSAYSGHNLADICVWSGGLDKTPSCFGGGFGYFCDTKYGNLFYEKILIMTNNFKIDSFKDRFFGLFNQTIHVIITRNHFKFINIVGIITYFLMYKPNVIKWYDQSLRFRKNKSITPFQHKSSIFLTKPSIAQLYSIKYGINKNYNKIIMNEIRKRQLFLNNIPNKYHQILFPFMSSQKQLNEYVNNKGIGEFTWVYSGHSDRIKLNDFLNDKHFIITLINTTWVYHNQSTQNNAKIICDNLTYLPNLNEMNDKQIIKCAEALTEYCKYDERH